jgi:hypothetical protein
MPRFLAKVDAVFEIPTVGVAVCLDDQLAIGPEEKIVIRERIRIRRANRGEISTYVYSIESLNRGRRSRGLAFRLPADVKKADVADATEVWLERDGVEPVVHIPNA